MVTFSKKFFSIFFTACILACSLFSGCSSNHSYEETKTVLRFSAWGSQSETEILKPILEDFEKENPDIKVDFLHIPQNYFQKLHLLFASSLAPDVVFLNNFYSPKYISAGLLEDLTPYFEKEINDKIFFEKSLESSSCNKKLYVIPRDVSVLVVYYNKEIFDRYNIPYPSKNWTIQDFKKTAKSLTKDTDKDGATDIWGVGFEKDPLFWLPFLFSEDGAAHEDGKALIYSEKSINALQNYADLVNKDKSAPNKAQSASLTMAQLFIQGKLAMQISGRWLVPKYRNDVGFEWDVVNFPQGENGSVVGLDSSGYGVSTSSKHKPEAIKLIKYLSSKKSMEKISQSGLIVPARKDVASSDAFLLKSLNPRNAEVFLEAIKTAKLTPVSANYQEIIDNLNKKLEPVFAGKKKAAEVSF